MTSATGLPSSGRGGAGLLLFSSTRAMKWPISLRGEPGQSIVEVVSQVCCALQQEGRDENQDASSRTFAVRYQAHP